jgi:hypothetical protein
LFLHRFYFSNYRNVVEVERETQAPTLVDLTSEPISTIVDSFFITSKCESAVIDTHNNNEGNNRRQLL